MELRESWGFTVSKIAQKMDMLFSEVLSVYDIDSRAYGILITLMNHEPLTQIKISEIVSIDRTTTGQLIDGLEVRGFVERKQNSKDRRQNLVLLTNSGKQLAIKMWLEMQQIEKNVIEDLSDWQKEIFLTIADRIEK